MYLKAKLKGEEAFNLFQTKFIPVCGEFKIPVGCEGHIVPLPNYERKDFLVAHSIVNSDYSGDLLVIVTNLLGSGLIIKPNERIAQLIINKEENI